MVVVDVGQGGATLVRTSSHTLLFDAGPLRPDGTDLVERVLSPMLQALGVRRLDALLADGVTTVEIKSGYGLEPAAEYRQLEAAAALGTRRSVRIERTFLGAHTIPPEFRDDREGYLRLLCETMIPEVARRRLASAVDAFCEAIAFTPAETRRVLAAARSHGLAVKLHADQLSNTHGAALAAALGALSQWRFSTPTRAGKPVAVRVRQPFIFPARS